MQLPDIQLGDVFCTRNEKFFGKMINLSQRIFSDDKQSTYSHSGIIIGPNGKTFEARKTINVFNIKDYIGKKVVIARPTLTMDKKEVNGMTQLYAITDLMMDYRGNIYPFWRIALHAIPFLADNISAKGKFLVCSELLAKYLHLIGVRHGHYVGTTPDNLADEFHHHWNYKIIFEGVYGT